MNHITTRARIAVPAIAILLIIGLFTVHAGGVDTKSVADVTDNSSVPPLVPHLEQRVSIPVSGVVVPAEMTVLRSQVAGVVRDIYVHEGMPVQAGTLLTRQAQPVVEHRRVATALENELQIAAREQTEIAARTEYREVNEASTGERRIAEEQYRNAIERQNDLAKQARRELVAARSVLVQTLDYLGERRFALGADANTIYRSLVVSLYGYTPSHIGSSILNAPRDGVSKPWFTDTTYAMSDRELSEVLSHVRDALSVTEQFRDLLVDAERYTLDRRNTNTDQVEYALYGTTLSGIHTLERGLGELEGALRSQADAVVLASRELERTNKGAEASVEGSGMRADSAQAVVERARALDGAVQAVYQAELALGDLRAPFRGQITAVHVERGELAQPGSPLVTISGDGAREFSVSLNRDLAPVIVPGLGFTVRGETVGYVDRVVTQDVRGTIEVFVVVTDPALATVGAVITGTIEVDIPETLGVVAPRSALRFDSMGSHVRMQNGDTVRVSIRFDAGDHMFVVPDEAIDVREITPARSVQW